MEQTNNQSLSGMTVQEAKEHFAKSKGFDDWSHLFRTRTGKPYALIVEDENEAILLYHSSHPKTSQPTGETIFRKSDIEFAKHLLENGYEIKDNNLYTCNGTSFQGTIEQVYAELIRTKEIPIPTQSAKSGEAEWKACAELNSEWLKLSQQEIKEAHKILDEMGLPDSGADKDGNLGRGKREELSLKQRLSFVSTQSGLNKEEIIRWMKENHYWWGNENGNKAINYDALERFIISIPSPQEKEETKSEWISVKDKLPTDKKTYTCYGEDWAGYPIFSAIYDEQGWYIMNGDKRMRQFPTHWKPIQSPPKTK